MTIPASMPLSKHAKLIYMERTHSFAYLFNLILNLSSPVIPRSSHSQVLVVSRKYLPLSLGTCFLLPLSLIYLLLVLFNNSFISDSSQSDSHLPLNYCCILCLFAHSPCCVVYVPVCLLYYTVSYPLQTL